MKLRMRMEMELLAEPQLESLFQDALRVWREVPFRVQGTDEFFDHLTDYGCRVEDGEYVHFPPKVIDRVLVRIAREKQTRSRAGDPPDDPTRRRAAREVETPLQEHTHSSAAWPESELSVFTHGQALHICDLESNSIRLAAKADLVRWCHVVDAMGIQDRSHPTFIPTDVPRGAAEFHAFATIILNSRKPHRVSVYSARVLPLFIEACRVAVGSLDEVKRNPVFAAKCWVNSPFMITRENIEIAMDARRLLGIPITFGQMPVAGAAVPVTIAGALVQNTAESLALNAMRLAIDDSTHGITGTSTMIDMRDVCHRQTGPDLALHMLAGSEMHAYLFGGRTTTAIANVAAQTVSPQSLHEKAMAATFNIATGKRQFGIGCLAASDVGSPVQLVLDFEMVGFFRHLFREVDLDDAHVGLDTILETAPRGAHFLETDHTARFFREECWLPAFPDHRAPLAWVRNPSDMIDRARRRARELYDTAENQCPLSEEQKGQIRALVHEADAMAGDT